MFTKLADWIIARVSHREPNFYIGGKETPYMKRWWVIPRNRFFNIYLHHILRDDEDRALHDHPWVNLSIVLRGCYYEVTPSDGGLLRKEGSFVLRRATAAHRLFLPHWQKKNIGTWSLFITGPVVREWGFHCPQGWRHWRDFVDGRDAGSIGKGCD